MKLFEQILDLAVELRTQVHVKLRHGYMNVILVKNREMYSSHFYTTDHNAGVSFTVREVSSIVVTEGTDGKPCLEVGLNLLPR